MELLEQSKMRGLEVLSKGVHWAVMNFLAKDLDEELTDISDGESDDGNSSDNDESNVTGIDGPRIKKWIEILTGVYKRQ